MPRIKNVPHRHLNESHDSFFSSAAALYEKENNIEQEQQKHVRVLHSFLCLRSLLKFSSLLSFLRSALFSSRRVRTPYTYCVHMG